MEIEIGELVNFETEALIVSKANGESCNGCYFQTTLNCKKPTSFGGYCSSDFRNDCTNVIFEKKG